jgi:hypothetical protein
MLDLTVLNAYTMYKLGTGKNIPIADFQSTLIQEILEKNCKERRKSGGGRNSENLPLRLVHRHFPSAMESKSLQKRAPSRQCTVCSKNKKRRESRYVCKDCNVSLCITPCFEVFHTPTQLLTMYMYN